MNIIVNNIRRIALCVVVVLIIGNVNLCACVSAETQAHSSVIYFQDFENDATVNDGWSFTPADASESYAQTDSDEQGGGKALKIVSKNTSSNYRDILKFDFGDAIFPDKGKIEIIFEYRVESFSRDFAKFGGIDDNSGKSNLFFRSSRSYALWKGAWTSYFQFTNQYQSLRYILDLDDGEYEAYRDGKCFDKGQIDNVAKPLELRFESYVKNDTDTIYSDDAADMVYWIDNVCVRKMPVFNAMLYDEAGLPVDEIENKQGQTIRATIEVDLNKYPDLTDYTGVLALKSEGELEKIRIIPTNEFNNGVAFEDFLLPNAQADDVVIEAYLWNGLDGLIPLETSVTLGKHPFEKLEFFISETGKSNANGTINDPFCNVQQALEAIKRIKNRDAYPQGGITITFREGSYANPDGISLTDVHSGETSAPVTWRAYPGEEVSIHGSDVLDSSAFTISNDSRIPESAVGKVYVCKFAEMGVTGYTRLPAVGLSAQYLAVAGWGSLGYPLTGFFPLLSFDGEPLTIARYPNAEDGYAMVGTGSKAGSYKATVEDSTAEKIGMQISAKNIDDDRLLRWKSAAEAGDLWAFGLWYHDWDDLTTPITSIDTDTKLMQAALDSSTGIRDGQRYYVYNLLEELDAPGEWFYDRKTDQLFVYPPEGKTIEDAVIHAAFTGDNVLTIDGTENTVISDLIFEDATKHGIQIKSGKNILVENCIIRNISGTGAAITGTDITMNTCTVEHTGRRGVTLSGGDSTDLIPSGNLLSNTVIRDFGKDWMSSPGLFVNGVGQTARNNLIEDGPQLGISFGGNDHLIEYNLVRDVMKISNDGGAIYGGQSVVGRGTVIRRNVIRDIANEKDRWVYGIYLDGRFCGTTITENVISNIGHIEGDEPGVFVNGGRDNTITNNLIVNAGVGVSYSGVQGTVSIENDVTNNSSLQAVLNNPAYAKYPNLQNMPNDDPLEPKYGIVKDNLVFNVADGLKVQKGLRPITVEWIMENNTLVEPVIVTEEIGFNDVSKGDYTLKDISAAYKWIPNFRSVRSSEVGPQATK